MSLITLSMLHASGAEVAGHAEAWERMAKDHGRALIRAVGAAANRHPTRRIVPRDISEEDLRQPRLTKGTNMKRYDPAMVTLPGNGGYIPGMAEVGDGDYVRYHDAWHKVEMLLAALSEARCFIDSMTGGAASAVNDIDIVLDETMTWTPRTTKGTT